MASNIYPLGLEKIIEQGIDTMTPYVSLLSTAAATYVYASTHQYFDTGTNNSADPSFCECTATDYTVATPPAALGKPATVVVNLDTANTRIELVITDITWTGLGGVANETITAAVLYDYVLNDLAASPLLAYFEVGNVVTTNQDFTLDFDGTNGNIRIPYTIG